MLLVHWRGENICKFPWQRIFIKRNPLRIFYDFSERFLRIFQRFWNDFRKFSMIFFGKFSRFFYWVSKDLHIYPHLSIYKENPFLDFPRTFWIFIEFPWISKDLPDVLRIFSDFAERIPWILKEFSKDVEKLLLNDASELIFLVFSRIFVQFSRIALNF